MHWCTLYWDCTLFLFSAVCIDTNTWKWNSPYFWSFFCANIWRNLVLDVWVTHGPVFYTILIFTTEKMSQWSGVKLQVRWYQYHHHTVWGVRNSKSGAWIWSAWTHRTATVRVTVWHPCRQVPCLCAYTSEQKGGRVEEAVYELVWILHACIRVAQWLES